MAIPRRVRAYTGRHSLVDHIPFRLPVEGKDQPAFMAAFPINADKAKRLIPGDEVHPLRLWGGKGLLVITVINYLDTSIGKYIEYSIAIACTHGPKPAPPILPGALWGLYGTGQYVLDLPVSSEISVKGGKGIWGMPKHQARLDFEVTDRTVSSMYELDGKLGMYVEIENPGKAWFPINLGATNYCEFRGMLWRSRIFFRAKAAFRMFGGAKGRLVIGDLERLQPLKDLEIADQPMFTAFLPAATGVLDDYIEGWFVSFAEPPAEAPEGMEAVVDLTLSEEWPPPPDRSLIKLAESGAKSRPHQPAHTQSR
jgi:hypothetical protein